MAYTKDIPQPADILSNSQGQILANFQAIAAFWENNHGTINSGTQGWHKQVDFENVGTPPVLAANQGSLYIANSPTQLYFTNGSGTTEQLTGGSVIPTGLQPMSGGSYELFGFRSPSGIIFSWGFVSITGAQGGQANFPIAYSQNPFVNITPRDAPQPVAVYNVNTAGFSVRKSGSGGLTILMQTIGV